MVARKQPKRAPARRQTSWLSALKFAMHLKEEKKQEVFL